MELWEKLQSIADRAAPSFKADFIKVIGKTQSAVNKSALQAALKTGNFSAAWKALNWEQVMKQEFTPAIKRSLLKTLNSAGASAMSDLSGLVGADMSWDVEWQGSYDFINNETAKLVTNVTEQTKKGISEAVRDAFRDGLAPPKQKIFSILQHAANIQEDLGLNARQMGALNKYRANLATKGLPQAQYDKMVGRYRTNLLQSRAATIARTETIQAACEGQRQAWAQAESEGTIDSKRWEIEWLITPDDITCKRCMTMKNQRRPLNGVYVAGVGAGTKGPTLHPNCRCSERLVRKAGAKVIIPKPKARLKPVVPRPVVPTTTVQPPETVMPPTPLSELTTPMLSPREQANAEWMAANKELLAGGPHIPEWYKIEEKLKFAERKAFYKLVNYMSDAEYQEERLGVLKRIASRGRGMNAALFKRVQKGTEYLPYDVLDTLERRGVNIVVHNKPLRAYWSDPFREVHIHKGTDAETVGHEFAHAVDSAVFGRPDVGSTFGNVGFKWVDNRFVSKKEAENMKEMFHALHTPMKGKYTNGDGDYWVDNWISNYEGRIYKDSADGVEWWSMNCQRYSNYVNMQKNYTSILREAEKRFAEATTYFERANVSEKIERMRKLGQKEWALRYSEWERVRQRYPKMAEFIEHKFDPNRRIAGTI